MRWFLSSLCLIAAPAVSYQAFAQQNADPPVRPREERREERRDLQRRDDERRAERREDVRDNREARDENRAAIREARQGTTDEQLAAVMLTCCNNEIQISKFAKNYLRTQEAKEFADRMIQDHQAACDKLHKIAGAWGHDYTSDRRDPNDRRDAVATTPPRADEAAPKATLEIGRAKLEVTRSGDAPRAVVGTAAANHLDWVGIHQQVGEECLASAKQELQSSESKQHADECYIGHQIAGHEKMISELKVFARYASPNLKGQIEAARETAEAHLKLAKSTMETLAKDARK